MSNSLVLLAHLQFRQATGLATAFSREGTEELVLRIASLYPIMTYLDSFPPNLLAIASIFVSAYMATVLMSDIDNVWNRNGPSCGTIIPATAQYSAK